MAEKEQALKRPSSDSVKDEPAAPKRVRLDSTELNKTDSDAITSQWKKQEEYVDYLETKLERDDQGSNTCVELAGLRESEEKLKQQQQESTRRENVLVMRLATKEHEVQDLLTQIHDMKQAQNPSTIQMRSTLLDPAVNLLFQKMKTELDESKEKLDQAQSDLSAWKFTPDSVTGKKLMAKCRMLIQENQDLGRQVSQGRVAQLEAELALQKKYSDELKSSQDELNGFVIQLDEEVEGMQSTIMTLQQQLKAVKNQLTQRTAEHQELRSNCEDLEKAIEAANQRTTITTPTSDHVAGSDLNPVKREEIELPTEKPCELSNTFENDGIRTPPRANKVSSSSNNPTSFSINKLLSLDSQTQDHKHTVHVVVPKLENGQEEGGISVGTIVITPSTNPHPTKGLSDGIGAEVSAFNVEAVN